MILLTAVCRIDEFFAVLVYVQIGTSRFESINRESNNRAIIVPIS
jgi:hypothetical protein